MQLLLGFCLFLAITAQPKCGTCVDRLIAEHDRLREKHHIPDGVYHNCCEEDLDRECCEDFQKWAGTDWLESTYPTPEPSEVDQELSDRLVDMLVEYCKYGSDSCCHNSTKEWKDCDWKLLDFE